MTNSRWWAMVVAVAFVTGFLARGGVPGEQAVHAQAGGAVYELRTYTAPEGKLEELHARFRNHTTRLFEKHGMTNVGYWSPTDAPLSENTLIYVLAHKSREAAKVSWSAFGSDPEWQKVAAESQVNGRIVSRVESVFLQPTDYSPMQLR